MPEPAQLSNTIEAKFALDIANVANKNALTALSSATAAAPSGPAGAIQFSNVTTFASDDANLHFNNTTNCLGVGTNTPTERLHVVGGILQTSGTISLSGNASSSITSIDTLAIGASDIISFSTNSVIRGSFDENEGDPLFELVVRSEQTTSAANFVAKFTNENGTAAGGGLLIDAGGAATAPLLRISSVGTQLVNVNQVSGTAVNILPGTDNVSNIGSNGLRWALVRATVVTTGDLNLIDDEQDAHWVIKEEHDRIVVENKKTNKRYSMNLTEIEE
jgi:hypothetical protein